MGEKTIRNDLHGGLPPGRTLHEEGRELVLCGDMNITRTDMDASEGGKPGIIGQRPRSELFETLLGEHPADVCRAQDPDNPSLFTWCAVAQLAPAHIGGGSTTSSLRRTSCACRKSCVVQADIGTSDHAPVVMVSQ